MQAIQKRGIEEAEEENQEIIDTLDGKSKPRE